MEEKESKSNGHLCCKSGPGYATPLEAMSGPRETLIYVTCIYSGIIHTLCPTSFVLSSSSFHSLFLYDLLN